MSFARMLLEKEARGPALTLCKRAYTIQQQALLRQHCFRGHRRYAENAVTGKRWSACCNHPHEA